MAIKIIDKTQLNPSSLQKVSSLYGICSFQRTQQTSPDVISIIFQGSTSLKIVSYKDMAQTIVGVFRGISRFKPPQMNLHIQWKPNNA